MKNSVSLLCSSLAWLVVVTLGTSACGQATPETDAAPPTSQPTSRPTSQPSSDDPNPAAPGFNADSSDPRAIELADLTMEKMGGRRAWDETRYITWVFFGAEFHVWDKHTGNVRIEYEDRTLKKPVIILMNILTKEGRAWIDGEELTGGRLQGFLTNGELRWINAGYWLFMPYKLKDSMVTLKYLEQKPMADGRDADVIRLTFDEIGFTPQNMYDVYIAKDTGLVEQWSYYSTKQNTEPSFTTPWGDWKRYGRIMLSDDRGKVEDRVMQITEIAVFDELPESVFTDPAPVDLVPDADTPSSQQ